MKKILLTALLLMGMSVQALVIKGGVHYTVESARDEAFSKVQYTIPMEEHAKYLTDPGFSLGKDGKPKIRKFGRKVTFFSDGSYAVNHCSKYSYYYTENGDLEAIEVNENKKYPRLSAKYDINGRLGLVFYNVKPHETYVYDGEQHYQGHWVGNVFFDPNGLSNLKRN